MRVDEHTTTVDDVPVFYRSADGRDASLVLYVHDALMSSDDLVPFLERTGGIAPDLIGFGRSGKGGHLDYSPTGLAEFLGRFLAGLGIETVRLVGHGWGGALGLLLALEKPDLVERLVLIDAVPLFAGFAWHRAARLWRRPLIGELVMGSTSRRLLFRQLRRGSSKSDAWSANQLTVVWEHFDQGTQRALLRLHRAADESRLAELGADLGAVTAPALIVWGDADPWFEGELADAYGDRLANATVEHLPGAGHWPWLEETRVIDLVTEFVDQP